MINGHRTPRRNWVTTLDGLSSFQALGQGLIQTKRLLFILISITLPFQNLLELGKSITNLYNLVIVQTINLAR